MEKPFKISIAFSARTPAAISTISYLCVGSREREAVAED